MLSYISAKFSQGPPRPQNHEARAALFLNRFTRTLTIMYASNGLEDVLGITADELTGKSFYYCIQENCLPEAIRCLESAKANDSIAYLRFWYRNPRQDDPPSDQDESMSDAPSSEAEDDDGGVQLSSRMDFDSGDHEMSSSSGYHSRERVGSSSRVPSLMADSSSHSHSPGNSLQSKTPDLVFDTAPKAGSSSSSVPQLHENGGRSGSRSSPNVKAAHSSGRRGGQEAQRSQDRPLADGAQHQVQQAQERQVELEAVVSCTSDGLVLVLRAARPFVLDSLRPAPRVKEPSYRNGFFASPWAEEQQQQQQWCGTEAASVAAVVDDRHRAFPPQQLVFNDPVVVDAADVAARGPQEAEFMSSIREVAVFAWALTGINGSIAQYGRGKPRPGAQPLGGLPIWERDAEM